MAEFDIEKTAGFLLAKAQQRLFAYFRQELADYGITPVQFVLLAFFWRRDGLSQTELSEKTEVDRTTISGLIERLQKAGLVKRRPNPADRRAYLVYLTEEGRAMEKKLIPLAMRVREKVTRGLAPGEYEKLCELLEKLRG